MKFSFTKETDLCTNCWKHKAVLTNVTYEYFDGTFKFGPVCVDCFDIDEFNKSTSMFLGQGHLYFGSLSANPVMAIVYLGFIPELVAM